MGTSVTVVGLGRIGGAFAQALRRGGADVATVGRGDEAKLADARGPILVTTRVDDLPGVVAAVPPALRGALVLVQNGDLPAVAAGLGIPEATLGMLWVAVPSRGATPIPGRVSPFFGPHARGVAEALSAGGIAAAAVDEAAFKREVALKLLWLSVVPVLAARRGGTVGEAADAEPSAIEALVAELCPVAAGRYGIPLDAAWAAAEILAYTRSIPHFPGGVKELAHRNHLFLRWGEDLGIPQPLHEALLEAVGAGSLPASG